jgi:HlyD family secretion protein
MANENAKNNRSGLKSFRVLGAIALAAAVVLIVFWLKEVRGGEDPTSQLATFVVKKGPLTISVLEAGTIQPRDQITLRNEVEGRTSIVSLVPDGSLVKAGDVLVELDASTLKDQIIDQDIMVQKAEAAQISAVENLAVIENQARSDTDKAELTLKFALQDLQQYEEGIYPKDVNDLQAKIRLAQEQVKRAEDVNDWSKRLYEEKYLSESEYTADRLSLQGRVLERDVALSNLELLKEFTHQRQIDQLTSDVNQAEMALERTHRKASADVVQAKAELKARELEYQRQQEKMKKAEDQLAKTTIIAPMEGMVVYATSSGGGHGPFDRREPMDIGVEVTERQDLINLPTTQSMKARVDIHETSLRKVQVGLPVVITVDALSGKKFLGKVGLIAPLPDARMMYVNPDLKVYPTDIYLEDSDASLRTGMSCKAEIIVAQYEDAVYVPVQAVLRVGGKPTVFVVKDGLTEEREVEVGLDDNNMIRIISGLAEGEVVWMTPPLKSGAIEPGLRTAGVGSPDDVNAPDTMKDRINQKLEEANGAGQGTPMQAAPGSQGRQGPPSGQMDEMRRRSENMSPEERQKAAENMKRRMESMTPEEREQMRQRFQGQGQGTGSRQGRGQRPADGQRPAGGPQPPASERNQ